MANAMPAAAGHPDMDYEAHERNYRQFLTIIKWAVIHIVVILVLMAYFLL